MNYINYESIILNGSNDTNQQTSVYSGKQKKKSVIYCFHDNCKNEISKVKQYVIFVKLQLCNQLIFLPNCMNCSPHLM